MIFDEYTYRLSWLWTHHFEKKFHDQRILLQVIFAELVACLKVADHEITAFSTDAGYPNIQNG